MLIANVCLQHKSTFGVHYRTGSLGLRVAGFPGHWVAGSQNVTQFHVCWLQLWAMNLYRYIFIDVTFRCQNVVFLTGKRQTVLYFFRSVGPICSIYLFIYLPMSSTIFRVNFTLQQTGQTGGCPPFPMGFPMGFEPKVRNTNFPESLTVHYAAAG